MMNISDQEHIDPELNASIAERQTSTQTTAEENLNESGQMAISDSQCLEREGPVSVAENIVATQTPVDNNQKESEKMNIGSSNISDQELDQGKSSSGGGNTTTAQALMKDDVDKAREITSELGTTQEQKTLHSDQSRAVPASSDLSVKANVGPERNSAPSDNCGQVCKAETDDVVSGDTRAAPYIRYSSLNNFIFQNKLRKAYCCTFCKETFGTLQETRAHVKKMVEGLHNCRKESGRQDGYPKSLLRTLSKAQLKSLVLNPDLLLDLNRSSRG